MWSSECPIEYSLDTQLTSPTQIASVGGKINVRYSPYNAKILFLFDYVAVF